MKKIQVKENYSIIVNEENIEEEIYDEKYVKVDTTTFNNLINFINDYKKMKKNDDDNLNFMNIIYKRKFKYCITIKNYVGVLQTKNGVQLEILPKIQFESDTEENEDKTRKIIKKMLKTLKEFQNKQYNVSELDLEKMNLYEVFINMYIQEVTNLINIGLKSFYIDEIDNINTLKGKILMNKNCIKNIIHKEKFFCRYDEFKQDISENRIIKSTLLKLLKISKSQNNINSIKKALIHFELVNESSNYDVDFSKIRIDRTNKYYEMTLKWSEVILKNRSFTNLSGNNTARALLFPMEKLFESYVAKKVEINKLDSYSILTRKRLKYLFENPNKKFALEPDIIIKEKDRIVAILDTKWKNLSKSKQNYGISRDDMYQMYAYAKKYNTNNIWLIYPLNDEMRNSESIGFKSNDNVKVNVFFVDLENTKIEESINNLINKIQLQDKNIELINYKYNN